MTPKEFNDQLISLVQDAEASFLNGMEASQENIWRKVVGMLGGLDQRQNGNLNISSKNRATSNKIGRELRGLVLNDAYVGRVRRLVNQFPKIASIWDEYFTDNIDGFKRSESLTDAILKANRDLTTNSLTGAGLDAALIDPVKKILDRNVTSGASFSDLLGEVQLFIKGNDDRLGALMRHSKQITRDGLNQFSANYNLGFSQSLGLDWFRYSAGTVEDSREFCTHRAGNFYHRSEVEGWASLNWQGKIPGTSSSSIFLYRGGYNCMHQILPVSEKVVPKAAKDRVEVPINTIPTSMKGQKIFIDDDSLATLNNSGFTEVTRTVNNINTDNRHNIPTGEIKIKGRIVNVEQNPNGIWDVV